MADKRKRESLLDQAADLEDIGLKTKLSILVESYNEQIDHVVRLQSDLEYYQYLELAEPAVTTHTENKKNVKIALRQKTKLLSIITNRILNIDKEENGQKN